MHYTQNMFFTPQLLSGTLIIPINTYSVMLNTCTEMQVKYLLLFLFYSNNECAKMFWCNSSSVNYQKNPLTSSQVVTRRWADSCERANGHTNETCTANVNCSLSYVQH
jgi:hypothetical protein